MSSAKTLIVLVLLWCCALRPAAAQFPYLHVYLNTPNCYAHSMGVMAMDSIDARCAKAIVISEKGRAMIDEVVASLGLASDPVALHTLPSDQFHRELWDGAFSRFVFCMGRDTLYDTNLDFLFQYTDSINDRIAAAGALPLVRIVPPLITSGSVARAVDGDGHLVLLDAYLNRLIRCIVDANGLVLSTTTLQLPEELDVPMTATLRTSDLFDRDIRYEGICTTTPRDGSSRLFATVQTTNAGKEEPDFDRVLLTIPLKGGATTTSFKTKKGFAAAADAGTIVHDTLYMPIYREDVEELEIHFGTFLPIGKEYVQIKEPTKAEDFPAWISSKLHGNYCNGFYAGSSYFFGSMPLYYHAPTGTYHDMGAALGLSLDSIVTRLGNHQFGSYYCSNAVVDDRTATILYSQDRVYHHATIDLVDGKLLRTGAVRTPKGWPVVITLLDRDRLLFISDDQVHAWIVPLE